MSYEANIHTDTSILPTGANASLTFKARGFDEDETPRLAMELADGDYSSSATTVHLDEIPIDRINDMVRSLRKAAADIAVWNITRENTLVASSDGPT